jgi:hypothetical protein
MIGRRFSRLVLQEDSVYPTTIKRYVKVICDCGSEKLVRLDHLLSGKTKSCGCLLKDLFKKQTEDRKSFSRLYNTWAPMKQRCNNPKNNRYYCYGGAGISVDPGWTSFKGFKEWALQSGYENGMTIDRIDSSKNYYPENCQWLSRADNNSKSFDDRGERKVFRHHIIFSKLLKSFGITFRESAMMFGIKAGTLVAAINRIQIK